MSRVVSLVSRQKFHFPALFGLLLTLWPWTALGRVPASNHGLLIFHRRCESSVTFYLRCESCSIKTSPELQCNPIFHQLYLDLPHPTFGPFLHRCQWWSQYIQRKSVSVFKFCTLRHKKCTHLVFHLGVRPVDGHWGAPFLALPRKCIETT